MNTNTIRNRLISVGRALILGLSFFFGQAQAQVAYDGIYLWSSGNFLSLHQDGTNIIATIYFNKEGNFTFPATAGGGTLPVPQIDVFDLMSGQVTGSTATIYGTRFHRACNVGYSLTFNADATITVTRTGHSNTAAADSAGISCSAIVGAEATTLTVPKIRFNPEPTGPLKRTTPTINASAAFQALLASTNTWSSLESNDSYLTTARLFIRNGESYPFVSGGITNTTSLTKEIQLQLVDFGGRRGSQYLWKLHFDAQGKPIGLAGAQELYEWDYKSCLTSSSNNILPTATSASGIFFSGLGGSYYEGFRAAPYAHYCDVTASSVLKSVEWSVSDGDPNPYICVTFPSISLNPKTRICLSTDAAGKLTNAPWIRTYRSDGTPESDFKSVTLNKPYEDLSGVVKSSNYWYGAVWRPSDGYVYQRYESTKFASELACRNQTQIDWRKTWTAINQTWTCVNVVAK